MAGLVAVELPGFRGHSNSRSEGHAAGSERYLLPNPAGDSWPMNLCRRCELYKASMKSNTASRASDQGARRRRVAGTAGGLEGAAAMDALQAGAPGVVEPQLGVQPRHPTRAAAADVDGRDQLEQAPIADGPRRRRPSAPGVIAAGGDAQNAAHGAYRVESLSLGDQGGCFLMD